MSPVFRSSYTETTNVEESLDSVYKGRLLPRQALCHEQYDPLSRFRDGKLEQQWACTPSAGWASVMVPNDVELQLFSAHGQQLPRSTITGGSKG